MARFWNLHTCQIDGKGRVSFPSPFRRVVSGGSLVLLHWQPTHLDLFPPETWAGMQQALLEHRKASKDRGAFIRSLAPRMAEVEPDSHGRIRIPPLLRKLAGLEDVALFVGMGDRIEVWHPARYEDYLASSAPDEQAAEQIFG